MALGGVGWDAALAAAHALNWSIPKPKPAFGHGVVVPISLPDGRSVRLVGCYHVSPHNTYTGRLTPDMLDTVLRGL